MAVEFDLEIKPFGDLFLEFLDHRIAELDHPVACPAIEVIVMLFTDGGLVECIPVRLETLFDHARLKQDRKVTVDRIAGDFKAFFLEPADKPVHVKVTPLTADPFKKPESFTRDAQAFLLEKIAKVPVFLFRHRIPY
jgi:hypothetical protein